MPRTVPVSATRTNGQFITGALWNAGPKAFGDFLLAPPIFRGRQGTAQAVANNVWARMALDVTDADSEFGHDNVVNNSRYTCQVPGWYWAEGYFATNGGALSRFAASIAKNGTQIVGSMQSAAKTNDLQAIGCGTVLQMAVGDYVEVWGYQNSGSTLNTFDGSDLCPSLNVFWIRS